MKQQEKQEILDELKAVEEAQKVSYLKDVWLALYGPLTRKKVKGRARWTYGWKSLPFYHVSSYLRRELTSQLIKTNIMFDEADSSLRDEFYNRIYNTLNSLLEDNQCGADILYDIQSIIKTSNEMTTPLKEQMKEIIIWHRCGLPVSLKEKRLLKRCLKKFLKANPRTAKATERIYREKMTEIYAGSSSLLKKIKYRSKQLRNLYAEYQALKDVDENDERVIAYKKREKVITKGTFKVEYQCLTLCQTLALAKSYDILNGKFPILEDKLLNTNR